MRSGLQLSSQIWLPVDYRLVSYRKTPHFDCIVAVPLARTDDYSECRHGTFQDYREHPASMQRDNGALPHIVAGLTFENRSH